MPLDNGKDYMDECLEESIDQPLDTADDPIERLLDTAGMLYQQRDYEAALKCNDAVLDRDPKNKYALLSKASISEKLGRFDRALEYYEAILENHPNNSLGVAGKIYCLLNQAKIGEAREFTNAKLEENRNDSDVLNEMAGVLEEMDQHAKAIKCYDIILETDPSPFMLIYKTRVLGELGRFEEAVRCLDQWLETEYNEDVMLEKGKVLEKVGRYKDALACYDRVWKTNPAAAQELKTRMERMLGS